MVATGAIRLPTVPRGALSQSPILARATREAEAVGASISERLITQNLLAPMAPLRCGVVAVVVEATIQAPKIRPFGIAIRSMVQEAQADPPNTEEPGVMARTASPEMRRPVYNPEAEVVVPMPGQVAQVVLGESS